MFEIAKTFEFSASHQLTGLDAEHPCMRLHGHNYRVTVALAGDALDSAGMLLDYRRLATFKTKLNEWFDHQHLNERLPLVIEFLQREGYARDVALDAPTTAEVLAYVLYHAARYDAGAGYALIQRVTVSETTATSASFDGKRG